MAKGLLAGFATPQQFENLCKQIEFRPESAASADQVAFFSCDEPNSHVERFDQLTVLVRGYAVLPGFNSISRPEDFARHVRAQYEKDHRSCSVKDCEGNFSVVVLDAQRATIWAYRNIASNRYTYLHQAKNHVLVSSNLAILSRCADLKPNPRSLPSLFMFRTCPGSETLFQEAKRLLPGQSLQVDRAECKIEQALTFADLASPPSTKTVTSEDAVRQWNGLFDTVHRDIAQIDPAAVTLLSGGVDSCMVHAHWMNESNIPSTQTASMSIATEAEETQADTQYAQTAAKHFGSRHEFVTASGDYLPYLVEDVRRTAEPPNHVQGVFYRYLAKRMAEKGIKTGLNGEGADSLFGTPKTDVIRRAQKIRQMVPVSPARNLLGSLLGAAGKEYWQQAFELSNFFDDISNEKHPVNSGAVWTNRDAVNACFGETASGEALAYRRELLNQFRVRDNPLNQSHAQTLLAEGIDAATLWTSIFHQEGIDLICPFLDSRVIRFALSLPNDVRFHYRDPKRLLKQNLLQYMPRELVYRKKLGFGQPIFRWMQPGGQLRNEIDQLEISRHPYLTEDVLKRERDQPTWFLFTLLCYDVWLREFG